MLTPLSRGTVREGRARRFAAPWLSLGAVCVALGVSGCKTPVGYAPNDRLLETQSVEETQEAFAAALKKAVKPRVLEVEEVSDERYRFRYLRSGPGDEGRLMIGFATIGDVKIYPEGDLEIISQNGVALDTMTFANQADAAAMTDLLLSLKRNAEAMELEAAGGEEFAVDAMEPAALRDELMRLLGRVVTPRVISLESVGEDAYRYRYLRGLTRNEALQQVYFNKVDRIDVQPEQGVVVVGIRGDALDTLRFANDRDSVRFKDVLERLIEKP